MKIQVFMWILLALLGCATAFFGYTVFRYQRTGRRRILEALRECDKTLAELKRDRNIPWSTRLNMGWFIDSMRQYKLVGWSQNHPESFKRSNAPPVTFYSLPSFGQHHLEELS